MNNLLSYNTRKKGYYRDREIEWDIDRFQVLTVEQIYLLHFKNIKNKKQALIKTRERLRKLVKLKKIKREKINYYGKPYGFYIHKPKGYTLEHIINRNWGYLYAMFYNPNFKLNDFENEYVVGDLQADGFIQLYSPKGKKYSYWFIESDRSSSKNKFDKIIKYNEMFKNDKYIDEFWVVDKRPDNFPKILIVTDTMEKFNKIQKHIQKENKMGLEFILLTVDKIRQFLLGSN